MAKKGSKHSISSVKHGATKALEELKVPGLIILGMVGGNMAGKLIDKVIKPDANATGLKNAKNLIRPVIQISAGLAGRILLKNENLKLIATGVAVGGVFSGVKVLLKKDLLAGLTGVNGLGETSDDQLQQVFREPLSLAIEPYTPDLPQLPEAQIAALPVETESDITGTDLGEYEEVKEISFV
jgi:hypothetical protein